MRVHELAKKLGLTSKDLLARLKPLKVEAKSHMSVLDDEDADRVEKVLKKPEPAKGKGPAKESKGKSQTSTVQVAAVAAAEKETAVSSQASATGPVIAEPSRDSKPKEEISPATQPAPAVTVVQPEPLKLSIPLTVGALAAAFKIKPSELIKALMELGVFANVNQLLNDAIVFKVAGKLGIPVEKLEEEEEALTRMVTQEDPKNLTLRPPVVTLMGHVDHGKTSLLDAIRKTNVADKEAGKITQHIGAYGIDIPSKGHVTFLDTPGHEAFTAMRARGTNVTDVVVLVVAADDGVMPQTIEAIDHAKAAGVPIVVAINKIDLPNANSMRVKKELQKLDLTPEEWSGKTICVEVSAKTQKGINDLLEMLLLEAEILELKANPNRSAVGTVIESKLTKSHGTVVTVLVQNGTLRIGDALVCGPYYGKIRAMHNDRGKAVKEAGPSYAAEVLGLSGLPDAGEIFTVVDDDKKARKIAEKKQLELREKAMNGALKKHISLEGLYSRLKEDAIKELKIIFKADVQGSIEALTGLVEKLGTDKISIRTLHAGIGGINESDVMLAAASDAIIVGFHVQADGKAEALAEKEGVEVRYYNIIYEVVDEVKKAMEGLLEPTSKEVIQGRAEIRQVFKSSRAGNIGGAVVTQGRISRSHRARLIRDKIVIFDGKLASLRRFKDDVKEVTEGFECGIAFEGHNDIQLRDMIEAYKIEKVATKL